MGTICLSHSDVGDEAGVRILHSFCQNTTLVKLELEDTRLGVKSAYAVGELLSSNSSLKSLSLENNALCLVGGGRPSTAGAESKLSGRESPISLDVDISGVEKLAASLALNDS